LKYRQLRELHLNIQLVPRSKHFLSRLWKQIGACSIAQ